MRILELRFKNLNSLYGEWLIDFTNPEYVSNGIFALTGSTGAGKSTILDAICLALYGATPRLGRITKSSNEIMSRHTGECFAEVTFESQSGRFCSHWSQHRARKKPSGKLADSKHEISFASTGKVIESKKREVAAVIEEKTGMDFDRFTRSILLAQGGFDTFLKANVEEKSKILEQITGTQIYTDISLRVHQRRSAEQDKLNVLQAETRGMTLLTDEEENAIVYELNELQNRDTYKSAEITKIGTSIAWLKRIEDLRAELDSMSEQSTKLKTELELFVSEREQLASAQKAAEFDGRYSALCAIRKEQKTDQQALKDHEAKLPQIQISSQQKEQELAKAEQITTNAKEERIAATPLIQKVHTLDQQLADKKQALKTKHSDYQKLIKKISTEKELLKKSKNKLNRANRDIDVIQDYLKSNSKDESLVSDLAGIEEQMGSLLSIKKDLSKSNNALVDSNTQLEAATKNLATHASMREDCKQQLKDTQNRIRLQKNQLATLLSGKLLRELRTRKDHLLREMAFHNKIADLETERDKLEDGIACPLCGALEHPFAIHDLPSSDETEKEIDALTAQIIAAEKLESKIAELEILEKNTVEKVTESEKLEANSANNENNARINLAQITEELHKNTCRLEEKTKSAMTKLQPLGIKQIPGSNIDSLLNSLNGRLNAWKDKNQKKDLVEKQISEIDGEIKKHNAIIETETKNLIIKQKELDALQSELEIQTEQRHGLFADKDPSTEQNKLENAVSNAERTERSARSSRDKANNSFQEIKTRISSLKEHLKNRSVEQEKQEDNFSNALMEAGFASEDQFLSNRLSTKDLENLKNKAQILDEQHTKLDATRKDRESRLRTELDRKITESTLSELVPTYDQLELDSKQLRDQIAGLKQRITDNKANQNKMKGQQALIESQKKECSKWDKLHNLIGSSDGKKYRNFAQGLTFELMVTHANQQLQKMTERYLLIRDNDQPLELNVVDSFQSGEIRSTKNLSGGESFIVSLSLALGLSKMASKKVRVDSLFLDEGFGTLDEDALETALDTLAGLHQNGKLIGIISHVSALKERIRTLININTNSGGRSTISGPGCSISNPS